MIILFRSLIAALISFVLVLVGWTGFALLNPGSFEIQIKDNLREIYFYEKSALLSLKELSLFLLRDANERIESKKQLEEIQPLPAEVQVEQESKFPEQFQNEVLLESDLTQSSEKDGEVVLESESPQSSEKDGEVVLESESPQSSEKEGEVVLESE